MALAHAAGSADTESTPQSAAGRNDIGSLPDEQFQEVLIEQAYRPRRSPELWSQFTSPQLIARTRSVLVMLYTRNECTMERRAAEISATQAECAQQGHRGRNRFLAANARYKKWRVGAANFGRTIGGALAEVNEIYGQHIHAGGADQQELRTLLNAALTAIKNHQKESDAGDYEPASHDLQLWKILEAVGEMPAEPHRGDQGATDG